jgi:hypothetical protein
VRSDVTGILICPDVVPGPAVEPTFFNPGDVVRDKVIAEAVSLVDRGP